MDFGFQSSGAGGVVINGAGYPIVEYVAVTSYAQTTFVLSQTPNLLVKPIMMINGNEQRMGTDYDIVGNILTWLSLDFSLETSDKIDVYYSI
jgi:hypothetical protein